MKRILTALLWLGLFGLNAHSNARAEETRPPLKVTVETGSRKDGLTVKLTVLNASNTYQLFQSISCSWQEFWQADSKDVLLRGQSECAKNSFYTIVLAPGEKHVEEPSLLMFRGKPGKRTIRFGYSRKSSDFTSNELKKIYNSPEKLTYFSRTSIASRFKPGKDTFWSAPITLEATRQSLFQ